MILAGTLFGAALIPAISFAGGPHVGVTVAIGAPRVLFAPPPRVVYYAPPYYYPPATVYYPPPVAPAAVVIGSGRFFGHPHFFHGHGFRGHVGRRHW